MCLPTLDHHHGLPNYLRLHHLAFSTSHQLVAPYAGIHRRFNSEQQILVGGGAVHVASTSPSVGAPRS